MTSLLPLRIGAGDHLELNHMGDSEGLLPYKHVRNLGHGAGGIVDMVEDVNTGSVYARKSTGSLLARQLKETKKQLHKEVEII